jgi:hypothetical protein
VIFFADISCELSLTSIDSGRFGYYPIIFIIRRKLTAGLKLFNRKAFFKADNSTKYFDRDELSKHNAVFVYRYRMAERQSGKFDE